MLTNLKILRKESKVSQKALADAIGVSQQSVNKYENHNIEPDIATLILIADYFGTTVDYLIGHTNNLESASTATLNAEERQLLERYRLLSPERRKTVLAVVSSYLR